MRVVVHGERPGDRYRAGRTLRSLRRTGEIPEDCVGLSPPQLAAALGAEPGPLWLVAAGAWLIGTPSAPPPSGTERPLCALGAAWTQDGLGLAWESLLRESGGVLADAWPASALSVFLDARLARELVAALASGRPVSDATAEAARREGARVVRFAPLDVHDDEPLRIVQVVTSVQQGGAERVAIDLATALPRRGVRARLVALGGPTRPAFVTPPGSIDLSWERSLDREARAALLADDLVTSGTDLVHAHLLEGADLARLSQAGVPILATIHNVRPVWPAGLSELAPGQVSLLVGCARAVEEGLREARLPAPTRTVWNGIDFSLFDASRAVPGAGSRWRDRLGFGADDLVLVAVANPRPQKRLPRLPAILAATRAELAGRGIAREVRLVLAGSAALGSAVAQAEDAWLCAEVERLGLAAHVRRVGSIDEIASLLAAADVLVSASEHEGLSLAQIEALAAGLAVVATDAGGTRELGHDNPAMQVLPVEASPEAFARALGAVALERPASGRDAAAANFALERMAERYARLYPSAIASVRRSQRGEGLLIVTNNFSMGGAQSSARRLLLGLAAKGVRVRAAVLEEQPEYPTPGCRALREAGVPVLALPPPAELDPAEAVARLAEAIDAEPPAAVLLWNAIAEHKVLLADVLLDIPLFDVSPGEMYFASLERYFARPRPGPPYRTPAEYGGRLAGAIVKYRGEAARASATLGAAVHVIPNGVVIGDDARPRREDGPLVIGTAARIAPHKKLEELLAALRQANGRLPPHVLRIAGGVERGAAAYAGELRERAQGLNVEWLGELADARPFLRTLDVFALVAEPAGCPNASLEAMAEGLPVVATDVGGAREQVEDGVTGLLVPAADPGALADALVALAHDGSERSRLGTAGRRRAAALFDVRRMVADYRRVCGV